MCVSEAERGRYGARHEARIGKPRQVDQPNAMFKIGGHVFRDGEGDRRLADTSGSSDCYQPLARKSCGNRRHDFVAADDPSDRKW